MSNIKDRVYIYIIDGSRPQPPHAGLYAVKFGRYLPERALCVQVKCAAPDFVQPVSYAVFLDGRQVAPASENWRQAFGDLYARNPAFIVGYRIDNATYKLLVYQRNRDVLDGVDVTKPATINRQRIAL